MTVWYSSLKCSSRAVLCRWARSASSAWVRIRVTSSPISSSCLRRPSASVAHRADGALETEEALDLLPQLEGGVDLVAELAQPPLQLVDLGPGAGDPLDLGLGRGDARLGALHLRHLLLDRLTPLAQGVHLLGSLQDAAQGAQLLDRLLRAGD